MEDVQATNPATEVQKPASEDDVSSGSPGFSERGRMRRRARFLRKARELAYRDLGGLVYNLHRFGQRNDALVLAKLTTLGQIDAELRTLEGALAEHQSVTVLRDAGIAACPRCAAIHGSEDRFCPNCGLAMDRRAERPVAGPPAGAAASTPTPTPAAAFTPAPASVPAPASASAPAPTPTPSPARAAAPPFEGAKPADSPTPATTSSPPPSPSAPGDYTTIDRPVPARSPQTPAPASPAAPTPDAPSAPAAEPTDQDQPTVIVRPPGAGA